MKIAALVCFVLLCAGNLWAQESDSHPNLHMIDNPKPDTTLVGQVMEEHPDIDVSILDKSISPCQDFYQYACGGWIAKTPIPEDRARWARGFSVVDERNKEVLKKILEDYSDGKNTPDVPYTGKLGDFYSACMNEDAAEKSSMKTLNDELKQVDALTDLSQLPALLGELHLTSGSEIFSDGPEVDSKDPDKMIYAVDQGGLGLPDRDYYLNPDKKKAQIRAQYVQYIIKMMELAGTPAKQAKTDAKKIMDFETELAKVSMDRVARRDPLAIYHRLELKGLKEKAPAMDWDEFLKALGYPKITEIDVKVPDFFSGMNALLTKTPLADLKTYLRFHVIDDAAPALPKAFVNEKFDFYSHKLAGQKKLETRWKRCVGASDQFLGFALGHAFVEADFGKEGKAISQNMIDGIEKEFSKDLEKLPWMDKQTKSTASKKLSAVMNKIGYPDKWRNYDSFPVDRDNYLKNRLEGGRFLTKFFMDKIGKPVDRSEWEMTPPTVNAYYDPQFNQMVFPAGILQSPFFNRKATPPANYGGIGMVMGHELTHGFDDQGRLYDAHGALSDWWSADSAREFQKRTQCLVDKYNQYTVQKIIHINGKLTLGENIADQGGMKLSYEAWQASRGKKDDTNHESSPGAAKLSDEQKYFLAFAQSWCMKIQPQLERMLITVDFHSPGPVRVNGAVSNFKPFADAFGCKEGDPMAPKNRCEIW